MINIAIPSRGEALGANGSTAGILTVTDTTKYYVGAVAWLSDTTGLRQQIQITNILTSTTMQAKAIQALGSDVSTLNYLAGSDLSTFTTAHTARIDVSHQVVTVNDNYTSLPSLY